MTAGDVIVAALGALMIWAAVRDALRARESLSDRLTRHARPRGHEGV